MPLTVSRAFHYAAAIVFLIAAIAAGVRWEPTPIALLAISLWQVAEATK